MRNNHLLEDIFMKQLCDDLSITYKTIDMFCGSMYALSRLTSQGRQQTFSVTPKKQKKNNRDNQEKDEENDAENGEETLLINKFRNQNRCRIDFNSLEPLFDISDISDSDVPKTPRKKPQRQRRDDLNLRFNLIKDFTIENEFLVDNEEDESQKDLITTEYNVIQIHTIIEDFDEDDIDNYSCSDMNTSCYATESSINTMNEINKNDN